ncbi:MAG: calcium-binding protein [Gammaproteobacteria bacterium]|nr:calcium-binding protein [Gammaproteobacteria bacterium]
MISSLATYTLSEHQETLEMAGGNVARDGNGNDGNNLLIGNAASNILVGGDGHDILDGGGGDDPLIGGNGNDLYIIDHIGDIDTAIPDPGHDTVRTTVTYELGLEQEDLELLGSSGIGGTGNAANNKLTGNTGSNLLVGGDGDDLLYGKAGDDIYFIDHVGDIDAAVIDSGIDSVISAINYTLGAQQEHLKLEDGSAALTGTGNASNNILIGNANANILSGAVGDDVLDGAGGSDELHGDGGQDTLRFDLDDLLVDGGAGDDSLAIAGLGIDLDLTGIADDRFIGLERINFTGDHNNALTLAVSDLLALSDTSDTLYVNGNAGDQVTSSSGGSWQLDAGGPVTFEGQQYNGYTFGDAHLFIDTDITQFIS